MNQPSPGLTTVTFAKSVPMSTYLSCFIVSDFVALTKMANGLNGRRFPISVYTTRAQEQKVAYALDIGVKIIEYYINLFAIDYPLPKLGMPLNIFRIQEINWQKKFEFRRSVLMFILDSSDMAAIPDFVSGAMENWGLVTYREARLLYDNETSSTAKSYDIVTIISHEFAHMWFGNLGKYKYTRQQRERMRSSFRSSFLSKISSSSFFSNYVLVEWSVAQRGFRFLHAVQKCGRDSSWLGNG